MGQKLGGHIICQLDDPIIIVEGVTVVTWVYSTGVEWDSCHLIKLSGTVHTPHVNTNGSRPIDAATMSSGKEDIGSHEGSTTSSDGDEEVILPTRSDLNTAYNLWFEQPVVEDILLLVLLGRMNPLDIELIQR